MRIDLNSDLGEGYGPWVMGNDALILDSVTSAKSESTLRKPITVALPTSSRRFA